jgi:hypothetical protein
MLICRKADRILQGAVANPERAGPSRYFSPSCLGAFSPSHPAPLFCLGVARPGSEAPAVFPFTRLNLVGRPSRLGSRVPRPTRDAPLFGGPIAMPPVPGREVFDVGREPRATPDGTPWEQLEDFVAGSNNWALAGSRTADGRAWVANDMHLHLRVPGVWYRARLDCPDEGGSGRRQSVIGVTVPGGPGVVVGSNGRIAWGFTNTQGDWSDLIELDVPPDDPDRYATPEGLRPFDRHREVIKVKGGADVELTVEATTWGPVIGEDHRGRKRALRWVACEGDGPRDPGPVLVAVAGGGPDPGQPLRRPAPERRDRR